MPTDPKFQLLAPETMANRSDIRMWQELTAEESYVSPGKSLWTRPATWWAKETFVPRFNRRSKI